MYTALIIDRSPAAREQLVRMAEAVGLFGALLTSFDEREALAILRSERIDVILRDWRPETRDEGRSLFRRLKARDEWADIPVFVFTADVDEDAQILALESGADDCHTYQSSPRQIAARMRLQLRRKERAEGLRAEGESLARIAATDPLTGLYNRGFFDRALETELDRCRCSGKPFSLLMIDLDHFKSINDRFGHRSGDQVLQMVSAVLRNSTRPSDLACRYGGEEFAVLLPGAPLKSAYQVAERIRREIAALDLGLLAGNLAISTSIGISGCDPARPEITPAQVIEEADHALYSGKRQGRNRSVLFHPGKLERGAEPASFPLGMAAGFA